MLFWRLCCVAAYSGELQLQIEKERTEQEKYKMQAAIAVVKRRALVKGGSVRDTSTIGTPALVVDANVSMAVVVDGQPVGMPSVEDIEKVKKYASNFQSIAKAVGYDINVHPSDAPTEVKLLNRGEAVVICRYTKAEMKNAYCALIEECGCDARIYLTKHKENTLLGQNYDCSTPDIKFPALC